jgi:hypothetical protein
MTTSLLRPRATRVPLDNEEEYNLRTALKLKKGKIVYMWRGPRGDAMLMNPSGFMHSTYDTQDLWTVAHIGPRGLQVHGSVSSLSDARDLAEELIGAYIPRTMKLSASSVASILAAKKR